MFFFETLETSNKTKFFYLTCFHCVDNAYRKMI